MDGSELGMFGTLWPMKWATDEQVAAFPIGEETIILDATRRAVSSLLLRGQCSTRGHCVSEKTDFRSSSFLTKHASPSTAADGVKA
ncbi:uncharacterized protein BJ212DRAFT_1488547 [Suillus subaureus]|uniref:Uncharacterized protein n=1 Tax=Suillus subaureus TaxID=48587 RepID=A0A9P7J104_9AGAM|nr:uncharacterized protein BJ212DRAFT_1488547 [Suillus subaureus]KAG1798722.1 hypothetical protein BJ212DRAFT_1488547 [Suillus subaureus]